MIIGTGIDIIELKRFERVFLKFGDVLIKKIFNYDEVPAKKNKNKFIATLAGKFAAKEAISKALGSGIGKKLRFKEISILNENSGKPFAKIDRYNLENIHISISHSNDNAVALAIIENK